MEGIVGEVRHVVFEFGLKAALDLIKFGLPLAQWAVGAAPLQVVGEKDLDIVAEELLRVSLDPVISMGSLF